MLAVCVTMCEGVIPDKRARGAQCGVHAAASLLGVTMEIRCGAGLGARARERGTRSECRIR